MLNNNLIVIIMGQNASKFLKMCLESVKDANTIIYCDGNSSIKEIDIESLKILMQYGFTSKSKTRVLIANEYNQLDKEMNGKQRNFYLDYLKQNHLNEFCLVLDADEVVEDLQSLTTWIEKYKSIFDLYSCCSVNMRHFIGDLGHEDATQQKHYVPHRLFKITNDLFYPLGEHPVLNCKNKESRNYICNATTIWHLAYIPNLWDIKKRYESHLLKSEIHTPQFLKQWYYAHLFGEYPKTKINPIDIPGIILNEFDIDKDEFYFATRGLEAKHFIMSKQWADYIKNKHHITDDYQLQVIEFGCGRAPYGYALNLYNCTYTGVELSQFAVNNGFVPIRQGNIIDYYDDREYDLILCIDVLEHLSDEELHKALTNITKFGQDFIFSVPVIGDPNLENDKTHKQFKTKAEWIKLWEDYGIKIKETPKDWLFGHQIFIGEKQ